ncbi:Ldh family oxidoreductase [Amphritea sp. 1_MG-2023]|uniref:Ldh family oxidoreductase n=1 Tax=Amphritea sp. 1_MG-2023 TaxID=3062670 RepID=UPI0026E3474C|nr:Ldh family oxidoreductase [Amphritea sp. 1_MG-2023]MDO6565161.1 Ldh family oxidoreductase [Amphritea sp. 1_MG-2023]
MPNLTLEALKALAVKVLVNSQTSQANANMVADALVAADADGLSSHGVSRLPAYADQAKSGKVDGFAVPDVVLTSAAAVRVDARSGFAFPAVAQGLTEAAALVKQTGIVGVGIGRSHHMGAAGYHVERMAQQGLIALGMTNSPAAIAPWGGQQRLFGTNPIAFACPRVAAPPLVIDLSLSKAARGKVKLAADQQQSIPEGWAVDTDGQPTTDAQAALDGSMLPMGDAKGAALVLLVEILSATLTGSNYGYEAGSFFTGSGTAPNIGHFFILIDPQRFALQNFSQRFELLLAAIEAQQGTRLPGERRLRLRRQAEQDGVFIPDSLYANLQQRAAAG